MRRRKNFESESPVEEEDDDDKDEDDDDDDDKKSTSKNPESKSSLPKIFIFCLIARIINSLLVQTYFNPDEHWQALEIAHRIAFGYGHQTWEWEKGIRSYLHPVIFAALYKVLAFLHLDSPWFMIRSPRLLQSIFAAFGDLYVYKFSRVLFGGSVAEWALFAQLSNWFLFFCMPRTFSNSLETVLTILSLYYWPCLRRSATAVPSSSRKYALAIAAIACAIRPTSAITWIYVGCLELFSTRTKLKFIFLEVVPIGGIVLGLTFLLDYQFYGSWVIVPLNFLKFNFFSSGGDYYGTHAWHWYLTQGFTVMLFTYIPFTIAGIIMSKEWKLPGLVVWVLGIYSLLGHKEFRFVLPVLPVALMFSGYSLASLGRAERSKGGSYSHIRRAPKLELAVLFLLVTNVPMALYMSMIHQRGTEDLMNYLAEEATENNVESILFLTPCHATPYYSTLHRNLPMRFLDCTPSDDRGILDESDQFLKDPIGFTTKLAQTWNRPSHIALFDSEEKPLKGFLASHHFKEIKRFFHSHFKVDRELQASVVLYAFQGH
ncbi:mannosyltransferase APTG1-like [Salvia hispanica]|uniref:mannosyltransferase APTG1-like n=1 Tax=Salvia hispanica TaxID=49212 RepID=UPI00200946FC|nr:mannosyltransferase APTG1-like [Salvia hispanica]